MTLLELMLPHAPFCTLFAPAPPSFSLSRTTDADHTPTHIVRTHAFPLSFCLLTSTGCAGGCATARIDRPHSISLLLSIPVGDRGRFSCAHPTRAIHLTHPPRGYQSIRFPGGRALGKHYTLRISPFSDFFPLFITDRMGGYFIARIGRAHSYCARTASTSTHPSGLYPSLTATPSLHIPSLAGIG